MVRVWGRTRAKGIAFLAYPLAIAAVCAAIASGVAAASADCGRLADHYASAPDPASLAVLQACLQAAQRDAPRATTSPNAQAGPSEPPREAAMPVQPTAREPRRPWGDWPSAEPWVHTTQSWPVNPW